MEPRDLHPGRLWSNLSNAQRRAVVALYGTSKTKVGASTATALLGKGLVVQVSPGSDYVLTRLGTEIVRFRFSLRLRGTDPLVDLSLHHSACDRVRDDEACCHMDCPVLRYIRESEGWHDT